MTVNFPCKHCEERHVGCHSTCEEYINARKEQDIQNERLYNQKKAHSEQYQFRRVQVERAFKKGKWA